MTNHALEHTASRTKNETTLAAAAKAFLEVWRTAGNTVELWRDSILIRGNEDGVQIPESAAMTPFINCKWDDQKPLVIRYLRLDT